ncbi:hypothetical protein Hte_003946 [Hypoxylon texense]
MSTENTIQLMDNSRQGSQKHAPLETLPPEIRRHILAILTLDQLNCLVRASPVFHQQYLASRRYVLNSCLSNTLDGVLVDALLAHQTGSTTFATTRGGKTVSRVLDDYENLRSRPNQTLVKEISEVDAAKIAKFHLNVILPVARRFISWAAHYPGDELHISAFQQPLSLSRVEETRLLRSLYRFQLCCHLFGSGPHPDLVAQSAQTPIDILMRFFFLYEPWEVEEMRCVGLFADEMYERFSKDAIYGIDSGGVRFNGKLLSPNSRLPFPLNQISELLTLRYVFSPHTDVFTHSNPIPLPYQGDPSDFKTIAYSRGLEPLRSVLYTDRDDRQGLVDVATSVFARSRPFILEHEEDPLGHFARLLWERGPPADRMRRQDAREPQPFGGDGDAAGPPLAWTLAWGGTYSAAYGDTFPRMLQAWACVLWDAARLRGTGMDDAVLRDWRFAHGEHDPRDDNAPYIY